MVVNLMVIYQMVVYWCINILRFATLHFRCLDTAYVIYWCCIKCLENGGEFNGDLMVVYWCITILRFATVWLARLVGNEGPSTFTLVYWRFVNPHSLLRAS